MLEVLQELFSNGYKLLVKEEFSQCRITVVDTKTNLSASQVIPIDNHLRDDNFKNVIRYCKTKLTERLNKEKNEANKI